MNKLYLIIALIIFSFINVQCSDDDGYRAIDDTETTITSPVVLDLAAVPYAKLSDYKLFEGQLKEQKPSVGVIPFEPISSLFTDYAKKKRFIWMPAGQKATYIADHKNFNFPNGTLLAKNFYYQEVIGAHDTRILETRIMIKKETGWIFANYIWNEDQTEAFLNNEGSYVNISWMQDGVQQDNMYRIPSEVECFTCHKNNEIATPIGTKPQSLNSLYQYADGSKNQLAKWAEVGYLSTDGLPQHIETVVKWDDPSNPLEDRVRSYLDINCAHCHSAGSHCDYREIRLAFNETTSPEMMGVCLTPQDFVNPDISFIVAPRSTSRSSLHFRMNSLEENNRMPLLGRNMIHHEGVQLIEEWINSLTQNCQ